MTERDFEYQLSSPADEPVHPTLVVVAGTSNNGLGSSRFSEGTTVTYAVQPSAIDDRDRERNGDLDKDGTVSATSSGAHHKPGILRLHQPNQHAKDFAVRSFILQT